KNLRARLSSYFQNVAGLHPRTQQMVTTAASVEWTVVATEVESLALEYSWIKTYDPRFNVKYRDDKSYPYLAVTMSEEVPRVLVTRGAKRKGNRYCGPFPPAWSIRETVDLLLRVFPIRSCSKGVYNRAQQSGRPCLLGYIDKCAAPCVERISVEDHRAMAEEFCDFMAGQTGPYVRRLEREMKQASTELDFERAARLRDDLAALTKVVEKNAVVPPTARTPMCSRWPPTSWRPRCRCSTCATGGSAASAAGSPNASRRSPKQSWWNACWSRSTATSPRMPTVRTQCPGRSSCRCCRRTWSRSAPGCTVSGGRRCASTWPSVATSAPLPRRWRRTQSTRWRCTRPGGPET